MASSKEYLEYVLDQLSSLDDITYRAMMDEYIIYYQGKIVGGIYDDRFLVKPTKSALDLIPDEAIRILKNQRAKNSELKVIPIEWSDTVFLCRNGTPVKNSTYDTGLMKYCDRANIPRFSMHVLRHTFATRRNEAGMKPKTLQHILGHSNIGITMNLYVHITEDEKLREINLVADALKVI